MNQYDQTTTDHTPPPASRTPWLHIITATIIFSLGVIFITLFPGSSDEQLIPAVTSRIPFNATSIADIAILEDNHTAVVIDYDGSSAQLHSVDLNTHITQRHTGPIPEYISPNTLTPLHNNHLVMVIENTRMVRVAPPDITPLWTFESSGLTIDSITPTADQTRLLVTTINSEHILILDAENGRQLAIFTAHPVPVADIAVSQDGHTIASLDISGRLILWNIDDLTSPTQTSTIGYDAYTYSPALVFIGQAGKELGFISADEDYQLYDTATLSPLTSFPLTDSSNFSTFTIASPDSTHLLVLTYDTSILGNTENQSLALIRISDGKTLSRISQPYPSADAFNSFTFSPDGRSVLLGRADNTLELWDLTPVLTPTIDAP